MNLVTNTYWYDEMAAGKSGYCMLVLVTFCVICSELRKVRVEAYMAYGSDTPLLMVGQ